MPSSILRLSACAAALALTACSGSHHHPDGGALRSDGGAGGGSRGASSADGAVSLCGPHRVDAGRVTPDILIILDRSASMRSLLVDRWGPSVQGIKAITEASDDVIHFGLMVFPQGGGGTLALDQLTMLSCEPGRVEVPIGPQSAPAIASALDATAPGGATPTAATLEAARLEVLRDYDPDQDARPAYVLLVTDGGPNCTGGTFTGGNGAAAIQPEAVTASVAVIADLAAKGVKTYVLGYDTLADPALVSALNEMAQAGGTGDQTFRPVDDQASLLAEFQRITGQAVSCDYALDGAVDDPTVVSVKLDGEPVPYLQSGTSNDGWRISGNQRVVSLSGTYCTKLLDGKDRVLEVDVTCTPELVH